MIRVKVVPRVSLAGCLAFESQKIGLKSLIFLKHNNGIVCQNDLVFALVCILKWQTMLPNRALIFIAQKNLFLFSECINDFLCEEPTKCLFQNSTTPFFSKIVDHILYKIDQIVA